MLLAFRSQLSSWLIMNSWSTLISIKPFTQWPQSILTWPKLLASTHIFYKSHQTHPVAYGNLLNATTFFLLLWLTLQMVCTAAFVRSFPAFCFFTAFVRSFPEFFRSPPPAFARHLLLAVAEATVPHSPNTIRPKYKVYSVSFFCLKSKQYKASRVTHTLSHVSDVSRLLLLLHKPVRFYQQ